MCVNVAFLTLIFELSNFMINMLIVKGYITARWKIVDKYKSGAQRKKVKTVSEK
jgi:hypothetical protein